LAVGKCDGLRCVLAAAFEVRTMSPSQSIAVLTLRRAQ
jgi:hypothetical protein